MTSRTLRLRLVGTLAIVVLVALAVLAALAWSLAVAARAAGGAVPVSAPVAGGALVLAAALLVAVHARWGYRRTLEAVDAEPIGRTDADPHGLRGRVDRLALAADVEPPTVAVVDAPEPNSFTATDGTAATVVVTTGLLEALPADELEAVLAHEVAHLANRDATVATVVAAVGAVSDGLFARERRLGEWIRFLVFLGPVTLVLLLVAVPVVVLGLCYLLVSVLSRTVLAINAICVALHARSREYAADRAAATLTGDPAALASALERLAADGSATPVEDARLDAGGRLGIVPHPFGLESESATASDSRLSRWMPDGESELDHARFVAATSRALGRIGRALEWRPATHPPTADRIERLRGMLD